MLQYIFLYFIVAGLVSFALFGIDKRKAEKQRRRISENHLLLSVALGGRLGGIIGMSYFHHKTIKTSFLWRFRLLAIFRLIVTIILMATIQQ